MRIRHSTRFCLKLEGNESQWGYILVALLENLSISEFPVASSLIVVPKLARLQERFQAITTLRILPVSRSS